MPEVTLTRNPSVISDKMAQKIAKALPEIVAAALTIPNHKDGTLIPNDIEVIVRSHGLFDINVVDLQIKIHANYFPERDENLLERIQMVYNKLQEFLKTLGTFRLRKDQNSIWILLGPAAYLKF